MFSPQQGAIILQLVLSKGQSQKMGQCIFDSSLVREYTIENPKRKLLSKGVHLQVPKELSLRKGMKMRFQSKNRITQPCQRGVNVDHKKSLRICLYDDIDIIYIYIYIYIMIAHNIKIFYIYIYIYEVFVDKILMSYKL